MIERKNIRMSGLSVLFGAVICQAQFKTGYLDNHKSTPLKLMKKKLTMKKKSDDELY
jgi:hypothetical protein